MTYIMLTCHLMGGLGNQLFQIFTTIAYALKNCASFQFIDKKTLGGGNCTLRYTYWETFLYRMKPFLTPVFPPLVQIKENGFRYNDLDMSALGKNQNVCLFGYFQSYKYFDQYSKTIIMLLGIEEFKTTLFKKYKCDNFISIHFRLGDYKNIQWVHPIATYDYYMCSLSYILEAPNQPTISNVMYFCEDEDIDQVKQTIDKLQKDFPQLTFERADNTLADWEQMLLMSCCRHNIIANSSYSWWAAYLNKTPDKIVCYPSAWFGPTIGHDTSDLCPPEWRQFQC
jgi:hypothetical protein